MENKKIEKQINEAIEIKYNEIDYLYREISRIQKTINNLEYLKKYGVGGV